MAVNAAGVPAQQDQSEQLIEVVAGGRELFSSRRLDVIVHLLALEELAGSGDGVEVVSNDTSWMLESEGLSAADGEPSVAELAAERPADLRGRANQIRSRTRADPSDYLRYNSPRF